MKKYISVVLGLFCCVNLIAREEINGLYFHLDSVNYIARVLASENYSYAGAITVHSRVKFEGNYYDVTKVDVGAFQDCKGLISVTIANSVSDVGNHAFAGCTNLTSVNLPNLTTIKPNTFENCVSLKNISIPQTVEIIQSYAFTGCTSLDTIRIPTGSSLQHIYPYAFSGCSNLEAVIINTPAFEKISHGAFKDCSKLSLVRLKEGISEISGEVFMGCTSLKSFVIPNSVTSMSTRVFVGCTALQSVILGSGLTTLPRATFVNCESIDSITIPAGITTIGDSAFYNCTGLKFITCKAITPPSASTHSFYQDCHLYVPACSVEAYKNDSKWKNFKDIRAYDYCFDEINPKDDEVPLTNEAIEGVAYTISGTYNAGKGSAASYPMPNKGVKFRLFNSADTIPNAIKFDVNELWEITGFSLVGTTNTDGVKSRIKDIYIDGEKYTGAYDHLIPGRGAFEASYLVLENISAQQSIVIEFEPIEGVIQANFCYSLNGQHIPTGIEEVNNSDKGIHKVCRNGTIYIVKDNKLYTLDGRCIKDN